MVGTVYVNVVETRKEVKIMAGETAYCEKCGRTMSVNQFYLSKNLEKYPNGGVMRQCKKCLTMHVDNWDPETFKWILQEIDVPYIEDEWNKVLEKYSADPKKLTGTTILGRYLSKMKLKQWKNYHWEDTEKLQEENRQEKIKIMQAAGLSGEEIEKELKVDHRPDKPDLTRILDSKGTDVSSSDFPEEEDDFSDKLTEEDKTYLRLKWGRGYRPEEWIKMEQLYEDMMASYDIQSAGHKDTLIMICKASLKANQLIDVNDVEGFQKISKVYDSLMKSGRFTAAQNKEADGEFIDSIGELVSICEKDGFIPKYYVDQPKDKVDRTLEDIQNYTRRLVLEETNLGNMIEASMKEIQRDKEREALANTDEVDSEETFEKQLFKDEAEPIKDEDYLEFKKMEQKQQEEDDAFYASLEKGE